MVITEKIILNSIYKLILEIFKILIPIITLPYIYRKFSPDIMGNIVYSQTIIDYCVIFSGFGVYSYGLREMSKIRGKKEEMNVLFSNLTLISFISTILTSFIYLIYIFLNKDILLKNLMLINLIQLCVYFLNFEWVNEVFEEYKFISLKSILLKGINLILIIILIKNTNDFYIYLLLINFFIVFNNIVSYIYVYHYKKYIKFSLKKIEILKHIKSLFYIICIYNIDALYVIFDKILLGTYNDNLEELAYYNLGHRITMIIKTLLDSLILVSIAQLSEYLGKGLIKKYESLINEIFSYLSFFAIPIIIGMITLNKEILYLIGGKNYIVSSNIFIIFCFRIYILLIERILTYQVLYLNKKEKIAIKILFILGMGGVILKTILIKLEVYSAVYAILITTILEILIIFFNYQYIKKELKYSIEIMDKNCIKYILSSLSFFICYKIIERINNNIYVIVVGVIFLSIGTYIFILYFLMKDLKLRLILKKIFWRK